jgi:hypothetical protein
MATEGIAKLAKNDIEDLAEIFDLLALYDHEDKLVSEPSSSLPLEDLGPDSN